MLGAPVSRQLPSVLRPSHRGMDTAGWGLPRGALGGAGMGFAWIPEGSGFSPVFPAERVATGGRHSRRKARPVAGGRLAAALCYERARPLLGLRASPLAVTAWTGTAARTGALNTGARHRSGLAAGG